MQEFWSKIAHHYWEVKDLEQIQRELLADYLRDKEWSLIELACGNWQTIATILKYNQNLEITWIDYNTAMIEKAKNLFPQYQLKQADIFNHQSTERYDYVVCLNSIHNFPSQEFIVKFFEKVKDYVALWGKLIFDIRNAYNPFISYGYRKNRKQGLDFYPLKAHHIFSLLKPHFNILEFKGISYHSLEQAGHQNKNLLFKLLYRFYLILTKIRFFAPYQFIIVQKKDV